MYNITVSEEIKRACPVFKGAAVYAEVTNTTFCKELWDEINAFTHELTATTQAMTSNCNLPLQPLAKSTSVAEKIRAVTVPRPKHCAAASCGDWNFTGLIRWWT